MPLGTRSILLDWGGVRGEAPWAALDLNGAERAFSTRTETPNKDELGHLGVSDAARGNADAMTSLAYSLLAPALFDY